MKAFEEITSHVWGFPLLPKDKHVEPLSNMPAYVEMKDFTHHYQGPADWTEGISWPEKCATTAEILLRFQARWWMWWVCVGGALTLSTLSDDLSDRREIIAS